MGDRPSQTRLGACAVWPQVTGSLVISRRATGRGIVGFRMTHSPYPTQRAPRVKLAGSVLALLRLENCRQVRARLHQLSINGGLLQLTEPLEEQVAVEIIFHLGSTTVRASAQTIFPMWATQGCLQPFRFTDLRSEDRLRLGSDLLRMLGRLPVGDDQAAPAAAMEQVPATPSEVVLYFDSQQDALRFTLALSAVIFADNRTCTREDVAKLARQISKVSRVTAQGALQPAQLSAEDHFPVADQVPYLLPTPG